MTELSLADKIKKKRNKSKVQKLVDNPPKIRENKIVFYASNDFSDNALALYEYMVETGLDKKYEIVWLVRNIEKCRAKDSGTARFVFVKDDRINMWTWEAQAEAMSARWLFFTHSMNWVKVKRTKQTFVNLWHGCGYKGTKDSEKRITYFDYCLVTGDGYVEIQSDHFCCEKTKVLPIGCPRLDWFKTNKSEADRFCKTIKQRATADKLVLWMPTFRQSRLTRLNDNTTMGDIGLPLARTPDDLRDINSTCSLLGIVIVIKSHNLQQKYKTESLSNIVFYEDSDLEVHNVNLYEMIAKSDALISDYSSVAIDYMLLDKPLAYVLDDFETYEKTRGWSFKNVKEYMPGNHIYNIIDMKNFLKEIAEGKDLFSEQRNIVKKIVHTESNCYSADIIDYFNLKEPKSEQQGFKRRY